MKKQDGEAGFGGSGGRARVSGSMVRMECSGFKFPDEWGAVTLANKS